MRLFIYMLLFLFSFFSVLAKTSTNENVKVIDGDSLFIGNREIRLSGIDAPEYYQTCYDENNLEYYCGKEAFIFLKNLVNDSIVCKTKVVDRYKREVADCFIGELNLNKEMVKSGYAVAYDRYTKDYVEAQKQAKKHKRGIWCGRFMKPELYRRLHEN